MEEIKDQAGEQVQDSEEIKGEVGPQVQETEEINDEAGVQVQGTEESKDEAGVLVQDMEESKDEAGVLVQDMKEIIDEAREQAQEEYIIQRLPPEMWTEIFLKMVDPRDFENAAKSFRYWETVIHNLKTKALFARTFPLLMIHLPREDIFRCRKICKSWCYGVDYFLQNNPYHRPVLDEHDGIDSSSSDRETVNGCSSLLLTSPATIYKTDFRLRPLLLALSEKKLMYNLFAPTSNKTRKIMQEAVNHPRCPIVGRSACILENGTNIALGFLEQFGRHLWFLKISVTELRPVGIVERVLRLLRYTPNLKKLDIVGIIQSNGIIDMALLVESLENCIYNRFPLWNQAFLPKLETFDIEVRGAPMVTSKLNEILLNALYHNRMLSVAMNSCLMIEMDAAPCIADLSLFVWSAGQLQNLRLHLNAPLRRIILNVCNNDIPISDVFLLFSRYKNTLRSVGLQLFPDFYAHARGPGYRPNLENFTGFWDKDALLHINLKRMAFKGSFPPSLNFLWGLHASLEHLHLYIENTNAAVVENCQNLTVNKTPEQLDLKEHLQHLPSINLLQMYQSNIWELFPKLKVLTVLNPSSTEQGNDRRAPPKEWEYRRDIYQRLRDPPKQQDEGDLVKD